MRRQLLGVGVFLVVFAVSGALALAASGRLPHPKNTVIVANRSIGGVSIGMSMKQARAIWGRGARCHSNGETGIVYEGCDWTGSDAQGEAAIEAKSGKVYSIEIDAGSRDGVHTYTGPLIKWKLKRTLHLGSEVSAIASVFPRATDTVYGWQVGGGKHVMELVPSGNFVASIALYVPSIVDGPRAAGMDGDDLLGVSSWLPLRGEDVRAIFADDRTG
jgi:hypothetical protein